MEKVYKFNDHLNAFLKRCGDTVTNYFATITPGDQLTRLCKH